MDDFRRSPAYPAVPHAPALPATRVALLRKVYLLFTAGLASASAGALVALYAGAGLSTLTIQVGRHVATIPPIVAWLLHHPIIAMIGYFGAFFGASSLRYKPGANVAGLLGFTFVSGLYLSTILWIAQVQATAGMTLSASPIRDAFGIATSGFVGLSAYAVVSQRDFSFLRAFVSMGLWVVIGASLLGMFVGGEPFQLAIASAGVLLFGAYILYQTSTMLRQAQEEDAVSMALGLYLSFVNLFLFILRILMSNGRRSD